MELEAILRIGEERFAQEYKKAKEFVEKRHANLHPRKKIEMARKLAKKAVDRFLLQHYNMTLDDVKAKIRAQEVSLDELV